MAMFVDRVKLAWLRGVERVGTSASNWAKNAKYKVNEINLESRRREILSEFSLKAFDMWQKGEKLPEPLEEMLQELTEVGERLSVLRAQRYADVGKPEAAEQEEAPSSEDASGEPGPEGEEDTLGQENPEEQQNAGEPPQGDGEGSKDEQSQEDNLEENQEGNQEGHS